MRIIATGTPNNKKRITADSIQQPKQITECIRFVTDIRETSEVYFHKEISKTGY